MSLQDLQKRVEHLEDKVKRMSYLLDDQKDPFAYLALEQDWTKAQVDAIFNLMEDVEKSPKISLPDFERRVNGIVGGGYQMAKSIILTFQDQGKYPATVKHLKKEGMNI